MSFADTIQEAVKDFADNGYDSEQRLEEWLARIQTAAQEELIPDAQVNEEIRRTLTTVYERLIERGGLLRVNQGVDRFVLAKVKPELRDELNRRILASANLIRLNRDRAVSDTIQRFAGWATSVPPGGTDATERRAITADTRRELTGLKYQVRRVSIDQGHKFAANLAQIVATSGGAIAARWHQHYTRYPRETHKERNGQVFLIRDSWADEQGLVRPGRAGYLDEVTQPGEEVMCLPAWSKIQFADGIEVAYRRWYSGELSEVVLDSGESFRATPNHPVMTAHGWSAVGLLKKGDQIVQVAKHVIRSDALELYDNDAVPTISEVFRACLEVGELKLAEGAAEQFHGDGIADCDVDIVLPTRPLRINGKSGCYKECRKFNFIEADDPCTFIGKIVSAFCAMRGSFSRLVSSIEHVVTFVWGRICPALDHLVRTYVSHSFVGIGRELLSILRRAVFIPQLSCITDTTHGDTGVLQTKFYNRYGYIEQHANLSGAKAGQIKTRSFFWCKSQSRVSPEVARLLSVRYPFSGLVTSGVKSVRREAFDGHVYNLQTVSGWYVADGIISHNCRCTATYFYGLRQLPDDMITQRGRDELDRVRRERAA